MPTAGPIRARSPFPRRGVSDEVLADSVHDYTRCTIAAFRRAGVMPEMVRSGNETRNGMLWPTSKLPDNWDNFSMLVKAEIDGVNPGRARALRPLIMVHYDQVADVEGTKAYYDKFHSYDIGYDVIGLSSYPWWHGSLLSGRLLWPKAGEPPHRQRKTSTRNRSGRRCSEFDIGWEGDYHVSAYVRTCRNFLPLLRVDHHL